MVGAKGIVYVRAIYGVGRSRSLVSKENKSKLRRGPLLRRYKKKIALSFFK